MCLHIVGLLVIYVLPRFMRGERTQKASNASTNETPVAKNSTATAEVAVMTTRPQLITKENDGAQSIRSTMTNGHHAKIAVTKIIAAAATTVPNTNNAHNMEQFVDTIPMNRNQCDTNVNTNTENRLDAGVIGGGGGGNANTTSSPMASATEVASSSNNLSNITNDESGNGNSNSNGSNNNNSNDHHLSKKIRERIDSETRLIEDKLLSGFDKTVTGIVELKDDLMRVQGEMYTTSGLKLMNDDDGNGGLRKRNLTDMTNGKEIETFLRKEMSNANVKVVLGNSQAD